MNLSNGTKLISMRVPIMRNEMTKADSQSPSWYEYNLKDRRRKTSSPRNRQRQAYRTETLTVLAKVPGSGFLCPELSFVKHAHQRSRAKLQAQTTLHRTSSLQPTMRTKTYSSVFSPCSLTMAITHAAGSRLPESLSKRRESPATQHPKLTASFLYSTALARCWKEYSRSV